MGRKAPGPTRTQHSHFCCQGPAAYASRLTSSHAASVLELNLYQPFGAFTRRPHSGSQVGCELLDELCVVAAVLDQRDLSFRRFKRSFIDQVSSEYTKYTQSSAASYSGQSVTNARSETAFWIDEAWPKKAAMKSDSVDPARLDEVYRALQETRIRGQIQYTNYVLSSEGKFWSSPSKQLHILGNLSYLLVVFAFAANFIALGAALWEPFTESTSVLSAVAIAFAILAVGVRAMLEGLRPQRETRRMQFYAAAINHADQSFETARTHARKIAAMSLLERASYDEMIEFISSNERARFVL